MARPRILYWFRTDLRLHDSPALAAALELKPEVFYPVWTWDPHYVFQSLVGINRWQFLLDCQNDLSASITRLNPQSKLLVVRESPVSILPKLFEAWKITHLVFERDSDYYAKQRDAIIVKSAEDAGVKVVSHYGRTLWDSDAIVKKHGGEPTMTINQLTKTGESIGPVPKPIPAPTSLPPPGDTSLDSISQTLPTESSTDANAHFRIGTDATYQSGLRGVKNDFSPPTMAELNMPAATSPHRGGETVGLASLAKTLADVQFTATFSKPATAPTAFNPVATTLLSPHMHFGSVSCRQFYWGVRDVIDNLSKDKKYRSIKPTAPPTSLTGQLLFRDMYFAAQAGVGENFVRTKGNKTARYFGWHLRSKEGGKKGEYIVDGPEDEQAEEWFKRWKDGRTGFPWIDAVMIQLKTEGWIHHLARHAVACFLTRGGCYIDWERGADVFEEWLLDHEPACNAGNWQWLSCTAFFHQYHRIYSPIAFPAKTDPHGTFVRHFIPALKNYPDKYIYEPWKCPIADQKAAGCRVGTDYPRPMFDFAERREECVKRMKQGMEKGLKGDNPAVIDGSVFREQKDAQVSSKLQINGKGKGRVQVKDEDEHGEADVGAIEEANEDVENKRTVEEKVDGETPTKKKTKRSQQQATLDGLVTKSKRRRAA